MPLLAELDCVVLATLWTGAIPARSKAAALCDPKRHRATQEEEEEEGREKEEEEEEEEEEDGAPTAETLIADALVAFLSSSTHAYTADEMLASRSVRTATAAVRAAVATNDLTTAVDGLDSAYAAFYGASAQKTAELLGVTGCFTRVVKADQVLVDMHRRSAQAIDAFNRRLLILEHESLQRPNKKRETATLRAALAVGMAAKHVEAACCKHALRVSTAYVSSTLLAVVSSVCSDAGKEAFATLTHRLIPASAALVPCTDEEAVRADAFLRSQSGRPFSRTAMKKRSDA